jgi:hypothetical protein
MHSFQPSRGRILFEVFCALAVVSSMVGAWRQTHASALLVAAAAAGLWAMARLFDLGRHQPAVAEEPQRIAFETEAVEEAQPVSAAELLQTAIEPIPAPDAGDPEPEVVETAPRTGPGRRKTGSRKSGGRRASAKAADVVDFVSAEEAETASAPDVAAPAPSDELETAGLSLPDDPDLDGPEADAEPIHVPHAPLFEPEPFVRMQRQAFGRRGRL